MFRKLVFVTSVQIPKKKFLGFFFYRDIIVMKPQAGIKKKNNVTRAIKYLFQVPPFLQPLGDESPEVPFLLQQRNIKRLLGMSIIYFPCLNIIFQNLMFFKFANVYSYIRFKQINFPEHFVKSFYK